jgi:hypothetical protein
MFAGSQTAHVFAYRLVYPDAQVRLRELVETGHGYMAYLPFALGFAGAVLVVSLLLAGLDAARGRLPGRLPSWAFALLPPVAFVVQEHVERWLHSGLVPWQAVLEPTFLPGLLLQLPFGLVAYLAARLLLGTAVRLGRVLASPPPPRARPVASKRLARPDPQPPRRSPLACREAKRGPPLPALA